MPITAEKMTAWCRGILGDDPAVPKLPLAKYLAAIGRLDYICRISPTDAHMVRVC